MGVGQVVAAPGGGRCSGHGEQDLYGAPGQAQGVSASGQGGQGGGVGQGKASWRQGGAAGWGAAGGEGRVGTNRGYDTRNTLATNNGYRARISIATKIIPLYRVSQGKGYPFLN